VVNLSGPVGIGKTSVLGRPMTTLELTPWPAARIRALAGDRGATGAGALDAVVGLSGGIPMLADAVCRALRAGVAPSLTGALADAAATVLLHRLRGEAGRPMAGPLSVVATLDGADDDLLHALVTVPADAFDRLAALSVVVPDVHGLTVAEPYRTVLDLAYQWRHPDARREIATRGASIRLGQIAASHVPLRARLADQVLYLSAGKAARGDLFPELRGDLRVRRAEARDADDMGRLVRLWAGHEGLDTRRADRMLQLWLSGPEHGFHVAVDPTGRSACSTSPRWGPRARQPWNRCCSSTPTRCSPRGGRACSTACCRSTPTTRAPSSCLCARSCTSRSPPVGLWYPPRGSRTSTCPPGSGCAGSARHATTSTAAAGRAPCTRDRSRPRR
jgi:hypothetical protein